MYATISDLNIERGTDQYKRVGAMGSATLTMPLNEETIRMEVAIHCTEECSNRDTPAWQYTHVYVGDEISNNPIEDIISGYRYNRPYQWYKLWVRDLLTQMFDTLEVKNNSEFKLTWAQRCGCTCRCSPGFFISRTEWDYTSYRFYGFGTIWFEIKKVTVLGKELQPANTETLLAIATA